MGWVEKQILKRKMYDDALFQESMEDVSVAVIGRLLYASSSSDKIYKNAMEEVLHALHIRLYNTENTDSDDLKEKYNEILESHGVMSRRVKLTSGWYDDAIGPMITSYKDNKDKTVALIPSSVSGYSFLDLESGKRIKINKKNENLFDDYAYCFYKSLPLKSLTIKDLVFYLLGQYSVGDISFFFLMMILTTLIGMLAPWFNKWLFGVVYESKKITLLLALSCFIFSYIISKTLIGLFSSILNNKIESKQQLAVEAAVMQRVVSLPVSFFKKYMPADLSMRVSYIPMLCDTLVNSIGVTSITSIFSIVYITQIFMFAPALTITSLIIIIATLVVTIVTTLMEMLISKKIMEKGANISGKTYSIIKGIQKIKLTASEKRFFSKWATDYSNQATLLYNPPLFLKISQTIILSISLIGTAILYFLSYESKLTVANYFAFNSAYGMVSAAFMSLANVATSIAKLKPMLDMVKPVLEAVPETSEKKEVIKSLNGNIEISNVSFRYNDDMPYVINNLSLKINDGEYIAIVGKTGCGKSTLLRLLLGFETPNKGAIYYDGKDFERIDKKSLRRKIGTVMQNDKLFFGDIFSNITISAPSATMDDAWDAAKIASIDNDIKAMPMGMHTLIAEGQGGISGGQRQRLMIARAVINKPRIIIFDEATSALDNIRQKNISNAIDGLKCTRIIVAHRLSTIKHADRIVFLDNGKIIEDGTYDELIKKNGYFAELVRRQMLNENE